MRRVLAAATVLALASLAAACVGGPPPVQTDPRDVLVVGDSIGYQLGCYLGNNGGADNVKPPSACPTPGGADWNKTWNGAQGGCSLSQGAMLLYTGQLVTQPSHPACWDFTSQYQQLISKYRPKVVILHTGAVEIVDRWITNSQPAGSGPANSGDVGHWSPPTHQWGYDPNGPDAQKLKDAVERYDQQLVKAVNILKSGGAHVIIVNSVYFNPPCPEPPTVVNGVYWTWWETYAQTAAGTTHDCPDPLDPNHPLEPTTWRPPNATGTPYRSSKTKVDQFNSYLRDVIFPAHWSSNPNVEVYDNHQWFTVGGEWSERVCPWPNPAGSTFTAAPDYECPDGQQAMVARVADGGHLTDPGLQIAGCGLIIRIRQLLNRPNPDQPPPQCQAPAP